VLSLPAWDCQPYDRASPNAPVHGAAHDHAVAAGALARRRRPRVVLTTVNAALQRCRRRVGVDRELSAAPGNAVDMGDLSRWLEINGFMRAGSPCAMSANTRCAAALSISSRRGRWADPPRSSSATCWNRSSAFDPETQRSTHRRCARSISCR
jgi:transcription-repair coupling factor (superfamily II helicase)